MTMRTSSNPAGRVAVVLMAAAGCALSAAGQVLPPRDGVAATAAGPAPVRFDGDVVIRATPRDDRELLTLTSVARNVWSHHAGVGVQTDVQIAREKLAALDAQGVAYVVMIPDVQGAIDAERAQIDQVHAMLGAEFFDTYRSYDELNAYIDQLQAEFPQLITTFFVGLSVEGRSIRGVRLTAPGDATARTGFLIDGTQHAREWISPMTVSYIAHELAARYNTDPRVHGLLDSSELFIVPVMNPDGYSYSWTTNRLWRKNRRDNGNGSIGVDLNRNWPVAWAGTGASTNPADDTYCGTAPLSEPEASGLAEMIVGLSGKLVAHIDFHSYDQMVLWPYSSAAVNPPEPDKTAVITASNLMRAAIGGASGVGYQALRSADLYPSGGDIIDWSYQERKNKAFTIELRDTGTYGFVLPAAQIRPVGEESLRAVLALGEFFVTPVRITFPDGLPLVMTPDAGAQVRVTFTADYSSIAPGSAKVFTRVAGVGEFAATDMVLQSGTTYTAAIPAAGCGTSIEYYFQVANAGGAISRSPASAPARAYILDALSSVTIVDDPCETAGGWSVGAPTDTATAGKWTNMPPEKTSAEPGTDHTANGTSCWITDGHAGTGGGSNDVDNGATTLFSPALDALTTPRNFISRDAMVSYWVWFSNTYLNKPDDVFPIWLSGDAGQTWKTCDLVSTTTTAWSQRSFRVNAVTSRTASMKMKFVAQDFSPGSTVECGVDDFNLSLLGCQRSPADIDADGDVDLDDFFAFFTCFDAGGDCADVNADATVDLNDFFDFFQAFDHAG